MKNPSNRSLVFVVEVVYFLLELPPFRVVPIKLISYSFITLFKVILKFHKAFASAFKKVKKCSSALQMYEEVTCFGDVVDPFLRLSRVNRLSIIPSTIRSRRLVWFLKPVIHWSCLDIGLILCVTALIFSHFKILLILSLLVVQHPCSSFVSSTLGAVLYDSLLFIFSRRIFFNSNSKVVYHCWKLRFDRFKELCRMVSLFKLRQLRFQACVVEVSGIAISGKVERDGVPDEQQRKTTGTDEGTGTKPGVPDVPSYKSNSDNESWGDSEDESDDHDDDSKGDDDDKADSDDDGNSDADDNERTDLDDDDDENPSFNLKDYNEEEHDEEYESDDDYENVFKEEDVDLYKDMYVRSLGAKPEKERECDEEMTDVDHNVSQEKSYEQVIKDAHVTLTSSQKTKSLKQSSSVSFDFANVVEKSVKDIIKDEVKSLPPQILPKEVSDFATLVIHKSLTEFELKKILLEKMKRSESYKTASEHKELNEGLVKSYNLEKYLFSKKQKTSKDAEQPKGLKSKESKTSSSKGMKSQPKSSGKSVQAEEQVFKTTNIEMRQD
nr:hypothetical protein [Tanacetum cinerariifolium]